MISGAQDPQGPLSPKKGSAGGCCCGAGRGKASMHRHCANHPCPALSTARTRYRSGAGANRNKVSGARPMRSSTAAPRASRIATWYAGSNMRCLGYRGGGHLGNCRQRAQPPRCPPPHHARWHGLRLGGTRKMHGPVRRFPARPRWPQIRLRQCPGNSAGGYPQPDAEDESAPNGPPGTPTQAAQRYRQGVGKDRAVFHSQLPGCRRTLEITAVRSIRF